MKCPYCDQEMQQGEILADPRGGMVFQQEGQKIGFFDGLAGVGRIEAARGSGWTKTRIPADYCPRCKKMIFDTEVTK